MKKPKIVCLCGSTKCRKEYENATLVYTLHGWIVLSVGCFMHHDNIRITEEQKEELDELHLRKIDLADEIFVINKNGYIGDSTHNEIEYAGKLNKPIKYLWEK